MSCVDMNEVVSANLLMYELNSNACGLMIGLLSMCEVIRIHIYIALVDLD